jgi:hypothetical protein
MRIINIVQPILLIQADVMAIKGWEAGQTTQGIQPGVVTD